jgi:hypothetical protein
VYFEYSCSCNLSVKPSTKSQYSCMPGIPLCISIYPELPCPRIFFDRHCTFLSSLKLPLSLSFRKWALFSSFTIQHETSIQYNLFHDLVNQILSLTVLPSVGFSIFDLSSIEKKLKALIRPLGLRGSFLSSLALLLDLLVS